MKISFQGTLERTRGSCEKAIKKGLYKVQQNLKMRLEWWPSFNTGSSQGYWDFAWDDKKRYLFTNLCPTKALTTFYMVG